MWDVVADGKAGGRSICEGDQLSGVAQRPCRHPRLPTVIWPKGAVGPPKILRLNDDRVWCIETM
jgi:hypothetical protein